MVRGLYCTLLVLATSSIDSKLYVECRIPHRSSFSLDQQEMELRPRYASSTNRHVFLQFY